MQIMGIVLRVEPMGRPGIHPPEEQARFTLISGEKKIICSSKFFAPVWTSDSVFATGEEINDIFHLTVPPLAIPTMDKPGLLYFISFGLKEKILTPKIKLQASDLYETLFLAHDGKVGLALDRLAIRRQKMLSLDRFVPIISGIQLKRLLNWWYEHRVLRQLYLFGLTRTEINESGLDEVSLYEKLTQNPYAITSISMEKAQEILLRSGLEPTATQLYGGTMIRRLVSKLSDGDMAVPESTWIDLFDQYVQYKSHWLAQYPVVVVDGFIYLSSTFLIETKVIEWTQSNFQSPSTTIMTSSTLSSDQQKIIAETIRHSISIITGPPGTGKSTVIGGIVHQLRNSGSRFVAIGYTGKSVVRLRKIIPPEQCKTIHRLLMTRTNYSRLDYILIDEASMITTDLMYQLLTSWSFKFRTILIGDPNQIPPIGWGALFYQLLRCPLIPIFRLTHNYRLLNSEDKIGAIADQIQAFPYDVPFPIATDGNFSVFPGKINVIYTLMEALAGQGIPVEEIKILTPYNVDVDAINQYYCRQRPGTGAVDSIGTEWKLGDSVSMLVNDYTINVMNGEEGTIVGIGSDLKVQFLSGVFSFSLQSNKRKKETMEEDSVPLNVSMLKHCYAITIDRSQGSEWNYVLIYVPTHSANSKFLTRNRLYTAITRARKILVIVGDISAVSVGLGTRHRFGFERLADRCQK